MIENKRRTTVQNPVCRSTRRRLLAILSLCLIFASSAWGDFQAGLDAYNRRDYETARKEFRSLAQEGNTAAMNNMGLICETVDLDYTAAYMWYTLAKQGGDKDYALKGLNRISGLMMEAKKTEARRRAHEYKKETETMDEAIDAFNRGDFKTARREIRLIAEPKKYNAQYLHTSNAQYFLGFLYKYGLGGNQSDVEAVKWYNRSGRLQDETVKTYVDSIVQCIDTLERHTDGVTSVAFSPDGKYLASGSEDNTVRLWNIADKNKTRMSSGHSFDVTSVAFSPDGKYLASGSEDDTIKLWDFASMSMREIDTLERHTDDVTSVVFPDGKYLVSGSEDNTVRLWNLVSMENGPIPMEDDVTSVACSPEYLAAGTDGIGSKGNMIKLVVFSKIFEPILLEGHTRAVTSVAFSPDRDSKILASGSADNTIKLWKVLFLSQPASLPRLSIVEATPSDYGEVLNAKEEVTVTIRIKNDGTVDARNLKVVLSSDLQGLSFPDSTTVPLIPKGGSEGTVSITIRGDSVLSTAKGQLDIQITDTQSGRAQATTTLPINTLAFGDIDVHNIPRTGMTNPQAVAVVIGNRDYKYQDVPLIDYAHYDARIVKGYLIDMLGYDQDNILYYKDATKVAFEEVFGTQDNHKGKLFNRVSSNGSSDIFIYYSGHGAPDVESKSDEKPVYLVPADANPSNVALGGYKLDWLYQNLKKTPYRQATVVIDACFSGISAGGPVITDISGLGLPIDEFPSLSPEKSAVFTAVDRLQVANWYNDKQHGLFTYFFLKALRGEANSNGDHQLTASEISAYVDRQVLNTARLHYNRDQNPQFVGNQDAVLVEY